MRKVKLIVQGTRGRLCCPLTSTDSATGITTTYYYDSTERLMKYVEKANPKIMTALHVQGG